MPFNEYINPTNRVIATEIWTIMEDDLLLPNFLSEKQLKNLLFAKALIFNNEDYYKLVNNCINYGMDKITEIRESALESFSSSFEELIENFSIMAGELISSNKTIFKY